MLDQPSTSEPRSAAAAERGNAGARWFVLHTRSRQEKMLTSTLEQMGIDCYLPLIERVTYAGKRKRRSQVPLFPSYVFLRGTIEQAYEADRTKRVVRLIDPEDQQRLRDELANLRTAIERGGALTPINRLTRGTRVQVIAGPFKGLVGTVEQIAGRQRLILGIESLGRGASLEIDASLLAPAT